ncbi:MAG: calcium/sodium antiporter [Dehalococcoidia bacterium]
MDLLTFLGLAAGFVLLVAGGEFLVRGASKLAVIGGISPLVVGLTVVAAGTSSPELAVSVQAVAAGTGDVSVGNVIGSNIFNTLAILGLCAIAAPLVVHSKVVRIDIPLMVAASLLLVLLVAFDNAVNWYDGVLLVTLLVGYVAWSIRQSRRESRAINDEFAREYDGTIRRDKRTILVNIAFVLAGLGVLILGARFLVDSGVTLARDLGVSDAVIGLTIIAVGTSLPEVATSVIATLRNERDIAIGNVVGSNLFNILGILGVTAMVTPMAGSASLAVIDTIVAFDLPVMVATALICLPMLFKGRLVRWEGFLFVAAYATYVVFLVLTETGAGARETLANALIFTSPLVLIVLGWSIYQGIRPGRKEAPAELS